MNELAQKEFTGNKTSENKAFRDKEQELQQELQQESLYSKVLFLLNKSSKSRKEISLNLGQRSISGQLNEVISLLMDKGLIEWTIPEKPNSSKQKFRITERGELFCGLLKENNE